MVGIARKVWGRMASLRMPVPPEQEVAPPQELQDTNLVLVACQPKSGSTFLTNALMHLIDGQRIGMVPDHGHREQELEEACIEEAKAGHYQNCIAQQHVRWSSPTRHLIEKHSIKTVVLVRNLFDVVASLRDHYRNESVVSSMAWITERHTALPDDEFDYVIARMAIPWYMHFYMSWRDYPKAHLLAYEDMIRDPEETLISTASAIGLGRYSEAQAQTAVEAARYSGSRLNVGKAGRGSALSDATKSAIREIISMYPEADADPYIESMT